MKRLWLVLGLATALYGQLEGRRVKVLLDMPGDDSGVDVQVRGGPAVNEEVVAARWAKYGPGLRRGQVATVTMVKAKGDHIEVQLNGGGFTNKQLLSLPGIDSVHWGMTPEEKKIKYNISGTSNKARRHQLEGEYDRVRARRVRPLRLQLEREERAKNGSRFNVRFTSEKEAARITPEELSGLLRGLVELVDRR